MREFVQKLYLTKMKQTKNAICATFYWYVIHIINLAVAKGKSVLSGDQKEREATLKKGR